ncbi:MAG: regulatory protein RecX [Agathobacter sp.]|nr:regulatory protein RecX [Agathobacter sp.]MDY3888938.1 regulatory protein RecX [Agathobacter sp.]
MSEILVLSEEAMTKGKIRVRLDTGLTCILYRSEQRQINAYEGSSLTREQYEILVHEILGKRATKRAMHLLEKMDRTEYKLREKLSEGGYPDEAIEDAIGYVKRYHYLDDERYARNYVFLAQDRKSRKKLSIELYQRGIKKELIDRILEEEYEADEEKQICQLLEKRGFDPKTCSEKERQKLYQFLLRRGFQSSDICKVMRMISLDSDM